MLLIPDESEPKVLLTTVGLDSKRPRYRIRGKLAPDLALRHVAASLLPAPPHELPVSHAARLSPGGGCVEGVVENQRVSGLLGGFQDRASGDRREEARRSWR